MSTLTDTLTDLLEQERRQHEELEVLQGQVTVKRVELNHTTLQIQQYFALLGCPMANAYVEQRIF